MSTELKAKLKLYDVFFISLGYIIGAGIYSLLYLITSKGKQYTWISFIIGGIVCGLTALSYSDLTSHFDTTASDYDYITESINNSSASKYLTSFILIALGVFTMTTLILAFTNILKKTYNFLPYYTILFFSSLIPMIINIIGVKTTSNINIVVSLTEISVLVILILISLKRFKIDIPTGKSLNLETIRGIVGGGFLTVFAYSGFETIPKLAEETYSSRKYIPMAMMSSIVLTIIIYCLVSVSVNSLLGVNSVVKSVNPITEAYGTIIGDKSTFIINIITLISIFNTILLTILFSSRQFYGIAKRKILPSYFRKINKKTETPINSIVIVTILSFICALIFNIKQSSKITSIILFVLFIAINLSAILLVYRGEMSVNGLTFSDTLQKNKEKGKISYYSVLGFIISICILGNIIIGG
jgi:basic amino acid/polyamine antiporter, APA family